MATTLRARSREQLCSRSIEDCSTKSWVKAATISRVRQSSRLFLKDVERPRAGAREPTTSSRICSTGRAISRSRSYDLALHRVKREFAAIHSQNYWRLAASSRSDLDPTSRRPGTAFL